MPSTVSQTVQQNPQNPSYESIVLKRCNCIYFCSQQYKESDEAQRFLTFYPNNSGPGGGEWPYVLVLDPRTGEKLVTWSKFDAGSFPDLVASFLNLQPDFNNGSQKPPSPKRTRPSSPKDNDRDICTLASSCWQVPISKQMIKCDQSVSVEYSCEHQLISVLVLSRRYKPDQYGISMGEILSYSQFLSSIGFSNS